MGIPDLWLLQEPERVSLLEFGSNFYEKHKRMPIVAVDMFMMLYEVLDGTKATGYANFHHQFARRINMFLSCGILVVGVFDGENKKDKWRNARSHLGGAMARVIDCMKQILVAFGLQVQQAQGEGETLVALLQRNDIVDYAFTGDSDVLVCGATKVLRYTKEKTKGSMRQVEVYHVGESKQWMFLMYAVLAGHDFGKGVAGLGTERVKALVNIPELVSSFREWYFGTKTTIELVELLEEELHTKKSGTLKTGWNKNRRMELTAFDREIVRAWVDGEYNMLGRTWAQPSSALLQNLWRKKSPIYDRAVQLAEQEKRTQATKKEQKKRDETEGRVLFASWVIWLLATKQFEPELVKAVITRDPQRGKEFNVRLDQSRCIGTAAPTCAMPEKITIPYHLYQPYESKPVRAAEKPKQQPLHTQKLSFASVSKEAMVAKAFKSAPGAAPMSGLAPTAATEPLPLAVEYKPVLAKPLPPVAESTPLFIDLCSPLDTVDLTTDLPTEPDEVVMPMPPSLPPSPVKQTQPKAPQNAEVRPSKARKKAKDERLNQSLLTRFYTSKC